MSNEILDKYQILLPEAELYRAKLCSLLEELLRINNIDYHLIESRVKSAQSFIEKISRSGKTYNDPLNEITDIIGLRIIVYYNEDVGLVDKIINQEFVFNTNKMETNTYSPTEFGYQSKHFIVSLSNSRIELTEWAKYKNLFVEIQVRTVLQHAWAAISHKLQYKNEAQVPLNLRRKLSRLSALLELADDEFLDIKSKQSKLSESIKNVFKSGDTNVLIDSLSVEEYLSTNTDVKTIVAFAEQAGFNFENLYDDDDSSDESHLVNLCSMVGIKSISDIDKILKESLPWVLNYFIELKKSTDKNWSVTTDFVCTLILIRKFIKNINLDDFSKLGWHEKIAKRVIKAAIKSYDN